MRYAVLADDLNHTCVYLIEADSRDLAVRRFLEGEWDDKLEGDRTEAAAKAGYLRFEVHEVPGRISGVAETSYPIFCSDDQIYDIAPSDLDNHLSLRHAQLGNIYLVNKRWDEAITEFRQARELDPSEDGRSQFDATIAEAYTGQGDISAAIDLYQDVLARCTPGSGSIYDGCLLALAKLYRSQQDHSAAIAYYEKYLELNLPDEDEKVDNYEQEMLDYIAAHSGAIHRAGLRRDV